MLQAKNQANIKRPAAIENRSEARIAAVKAVYSNEMNEKKKGAVVLMADMMVYYMDEHISPKPDEKYLRKLLEGIEENLKVIDGKIEKLLQDGWNLTRLDKVVLSILRVAIFELMVLHEVPYKVILNEYVEITRMFVDESEVTFVNALLDKVAHEVRDI